MKNATMLYRCPGPHRTDGIDYDYIIVDEPEIEAKLSEGWRLRYDEAHETMKATADKIEANEAELQRIEQKLEAAEAPKLRAVHKGRGVWALVDASGAEVETGLSREEAQAKVTP